MPAAAFALWSVRARTGGNCGSKMSAQQKGSAILKMLIEVSRKIKAIHLTTISISSVVSSRIDPESSLANAGFAALRSNDVRARLVLDIIDPRSNEKAVIGHSQGKANMMHRSQKSVPLLSFFE
jgi:hypothetical protein